MDPAADFSLIVGKTINRAYIDFTHQNILLRCTDESWFNMSAPVGSPEAVFFTHVIGVAAMFEGIVSSFTLLDALDVNIITTLGTTSFQSVLLQSSMFINGMLDLYQVNDIESYDDNRAVRLITVGPGNYKEELYEVIRADF